MMLFLTILSISFVVTCIYGLTGMFSLKIMSIIGLAIVFINLFASFIIPKDAEKYRNILKNIAQDKEKGRK